MEVVIKTSVFVEECFYAIMHYSSCDGYLHHASSSYEPVSRGRSMISKLRLSDGSFYWQAWQLRVGLWPCCHIPPTALLDIS
jgi:hypothetical protein